MRQFLEALFRFIIIKCTISLERPGNNQHKIATIYSFKFDTRSRCDFRRKLDQ
jgi:hypothetical protein